MISIKNSTHKNLAFRRRLLADQMPAETISLGSGVNRTGYSAGSGRITCPDAVGFAADARTLMGAAIYYCRVILRQDMDDDAAMLAAVDSGTSELIAEYIGESDADYVMPGSRLHQLGERLLDAIPSGGISRRKAMDLLAWIGQEIGHEYWATLTPLDIGFDPTLHDMSIDC